MICCRLEAVIGAGEGGWKRGAGYWKWARDSISWILSENFDPQPGHLFCRTEPPCLPLLPVRAWELESLAWLEINCLVLRQPRFSCDSPPPTHTQSRFSLCLLHSPPHHHTSLCPDMVTVEQCFSGRGLLASPLRPGVCMQMPEKRRGRGGILREKSGAGLPAPEICSAKGRLCRLSPRDWIGIFMLSVQPLSL